MIKNAILDDFMKPSNALAFTRQETIPMNIRTLALAFLCTASHLHAEPYLPLVPEKIVVQHNGGPSVSMLTLHDAIQALARHASDYPPVFDNAADKTRAQQDVQYLASVADVLGDDAIRNQDIPVIKLFARLYWIGHNLDQPGHAQRADTFYAVWMENADDKPAVQEEYGRFLASSEQGERAEPLLRAAYQNGRKQAAMPLGMLMLAQEKKDEALALLREYAAAFPEDPRAAKLIEAVETGKYEIKRTYVTP